ncbi:MAG: C40 family peptidase [Burkholderiaceae bacterium]|nr:C40 family peptidase [Burkholderiaceae bacterium]
MQIRRTALTLSLALGLATGACAAPAGAQNASPDEMNKFLADRGLIGQLQQMGQTVQQRTAELVVTAMGSLGVPYKRGGNSADAGGFDCSGFVRAMYEQTLGLVLPRRAEQQAAATQTIDRNELQPGDLVFFNTLRRAFSHVGIYVGDGKFIHSPRPGAQVRVESMHTSYWDRRFDGARRVASDAPATVAATGAAQTLSATLPVRLPIEQPQP